MNFRVHKGTFSSKKNTFLKFLGSFLLKNEISTKYGHVTYQKKALY